MFLRGAAGAIIGLVFMFTTSYRLTRVVIAFPPLIAGAMWQGRRLRLLSKETQTALAQATAVAEDSIGAVRTVRAFAREDDEAGALLRVRQQGARRGMRYGFSGATFNGALMAASTVTLGVTFWYGTLLAIEGDMTVGELNAFILYSINSAFGVALIAGTFVSIVQALGASTRVFELLDRQSGIALDGVEKPAPGASGVEVALRDVHFAYPSSPIAPYSADSRSSSPRDRAPPSSGPRAPVNPPSPRSSSDTTNPPPGPSQSRAFPSG